MTELWAGNISENTYNKHLTFFRSMFSAISINAGLNENVWKKKYLTRRSILMVIRKIDMGA
jgi:hypothetical protein